MSLQTQQIKEIAVSVSKEADMKPYKPNHETELDKLSVDQLVPFL